MSNPALASTDRSARKANDAAPSGTADSSYVVRCSAPFEWADRARQVYKSNVSNWEGVTRVSLAGEHEQDPLPFHVRYFEIAGGGFSSLEQHAHQHVVVVLRGCGTVRLGNRQSPLGVGDLVYVAPWTVHQFVNEDSESPLGFLCIVSAERDRPKVIDGGPSFCELPIRPGGDGI